MVFFFSQAEKHPLHLQHRVGGIHMEGLHRPLPDGPKHLVLCGQPLFQVPVLLPRVQHLNQLSLPRQKERPPAFTPSETLASKKKDLETLLCVD